MPSTSGVAVAINTENLGDELVGSHSIGATVLQVGDVFDFAETGQVIVNREDAVGGNPGEVYSYNKIDADAETISLATTTSVAYGDGTKVEAYPLTVVKYATVQLGEDQAAVDAAVDHALFPLLHEGNYPDGIVVEVESASIGRFQLRVKNTPGLDPLYNASEAPIVTSTAGGERVQIDGDGITLYTNDPVQQLAFTTTGLPIGVAVDATGYIYVADQTNSKVRKFVADGSQVLTGGFPISVTGGCTSIALDSSGNIYTGGATAVRKFDTSGTQTLTFATTTAAGIAVDTSGNIYVADSVANLIRKYNSAGTAGITISTTGQPLGVAVDASGNIFAPDITNSLVRKFNAAGTQTLSFARTNGNGIAVDAAGYIYVTNYSAVVKYDAAGVAVTGYPFGFGFDGRQTDVAVDAAGNVYAADANNFVIRKYNNPGVVISSGRLISALGRLLAFNATIAGNLEVDSISSVNGLQITSPVTMLQKTQGKTDVSVTSGTGTTTVVVVYDVAFLTKPVVNFTPNDAKLSAPTLTASSTSGFTVQWSRSATGTYTFGWTATVPT